MRRLLLLALSISGLCACDDTLFVTEDGGTDVPEDYTPDWAGAQALIEDHCVECHGGAGTGGVALPGDVDLDLQNSAGELVVAGDPAASRLWRVLEGDTSQGEAAMPLGTGPLDASLTAHVKTWIEAGAPLDASDTDVQ